MLLLSHHTASTKSSINLILCWKNVHQTLGHHHMLQNKSPSYPWSQMILSREQCLSQKHSHIALHISICRHTSETSQVWFPPLQRSEYCKKVSHIKSLSFSVHTEVMLTLHCMQQHYVWKDKVQTLIFKYFIHKICLIYM